MERRSFLATIGALAVGLPALPAQATGSGRACGAASADFEEERLDLGVDPTASDDERELAHFFSEQLEAPADNRFAVTNGGKLLTHSTLEGFRVRGAHGSSRDISAPSGGRLISDFRIKAQALQLRTGSPYDKLAVASPNANFEVWNDAFAVTDVVWSPAGLVVGHGELARNDGRLSLLDGARPLRELARTEAPPRQLVVSGTRVFYFLGERAFMLDLQQPSAPPVACGWLPELPRAALYADGALLALTAGGLFRLTADRAATQVLSEANAHSLFKTESLVVVASHRRAWLLKGTRRQTFEAPHQNLHHVARVPDSDDLLFCRGRSVLRRSAAHGRIEAVGQGRADWKLRGAQLFDGRLVTWSSRTWRVVGPDCRAQLPPRRYLLD
jgi:hypothetical protein